MLNPLILGLLRKGFGSGMVYYQSGVSATMDITSNAFFLPSTINLSKYCGSSGNRKKATINDGTKNAIGYADSVYTTRGFLIYTDKNGSTRGFASIESDFNPNSATFTVKIERV